jgi:hypothetical protein
MRRLRTAAAWAARDAGDGQARIRLATEGIAGSLIPEDFQHISALPLIGGRPIVIVQEGGIMPTIEVYRNGVCEVNPDPTCNIRDIMTQTIEGHPQLFFILIRRPLEQKWK